jgi:hypothetical protein
MKISRLVKDERQNPDLESQINIRELLESVEIEEVEEISLADITRENITVVREYAHSSIIPLLCKKLIDFRYIDKIYQLKFGRTLRWIPIKGLVENYDEHLDQNQDQDQAQDQENSPTINGLVKYGGVLVKILFVESGTNLLIRSRLGFNQIKMSDNLVFQRLSDDEKIVMGCRNLLQKI